MKDVGEEVASADCYAEVGVLAVPQPGSGPATRSGWLPGCPTSDCARLSEELMKRVLHSASVRVKGLGL